MYYKFARSKEKTQSRPPPQAAGIALRYPFQEVRIKLIKELNSKLTYHDALCDKHSEVVVKNAAKLIAENL